MADPHPSAGGIAGEHLSFEQRLEEALVRPLLLTSERRCLLEPLKHARRLQLAEQVRQPLPPPRPSRAPAPPPHRPRRGGPPPAPPPPPPPPAAGGGGGGPPPPRGPARPAPGPPPR